MANRSASTTRGYPEHSHHRDGPAIRISPESALEPSFAPVALNDWPPGQATRLPVRDSVSRHSLPSVVDAPCTSMASPHACGAAGRSP